MALTTRLANVGDAGPAQPHLELDPLSLLGTCHAMPLQKLNDPVRESLSLDKGRPHTCSAFGRPGHKCSSMQPQISHMGAADNLSMTLHTAPNIEMTESPT